MDVRRGGGRWSSPPPYRIDAAFEFNDARAPHEPTLTIVR